MKEKKKGKMEEGDFECETSTVFTWLKVNLLLMARLSTKFKGAGEGIPVTNNKLFF